MKIIVIDILAWFVIHMSISYAVTQMPLRMFNSALWLYRSRWPEAENRIYKRFLFIHSWKKLLPDGAALFERGCRKKNLSAKDPAYIVRFIEETCRGECAHWITFICAPLFFFWNEAAVGWIMIIYAFLANFPCIVTQRYNRFRLQKFIWSYTQRQ
jgi:glycosyl-4,4'-diaponeurosporenoate acyltransferase